MYFIQEEIMIQISNLKKTFKLSKKQMIANGDKVNFKTAVKNISFQVNDNEIFGLLGPN
jgi:ABC-type oligopeptide transport system ATPase subunit